MSENHLNSLAMVSIEGNNLEKINLSKIMMITEYTQQKARSQIVKKN